MTRDEWEIRAKEFCKRGMDLPQTKLPPKAIVEIRKAAAMRAELRREITEKYSNAALAKKWGIHPRTVEKILNFETWSHIR